MISPNEIGRDAKVAGGGVLMIYQIRFERCFETPPNMPVHDRTSPELASGPHRRTLRFAKWNCTPFKSLLKKLQKSMNPKMYVKSCRSRPHIISRAIQQARLRGSVQRYLAHKKIALPQFPSVSLCLGPCGGPRWGSFFTSEVPVEDVGDGEEKKQGGGAEI